MNKKKRALERAKLLRRQSLGYCGYTVHYQDGSVFESWLHPSGFVHMEKLSFGEIRSILEGNSYL
jgi:hypothetical protein